jgi:hypothetical protein
MVVRYSRAFGCGCCSRNQDADESRVTAGGFRVSLRVVLSVISSHAVGEIVLA